MKNEKWIFNFQFSNKNWKLKIEKFLSFFNFQFWIEIEIPKNVLFHSNFKMKIEWHFRCTDWFWLPFSCLNEFYFEFSIPSFVFHFYKKNGKRNTVRFSFFVFIKELKNELFKNIKINIMVIFTSIVCTLFKRKIV